MTRYSDRTEIANHPLSPVSKFKRFSKFRLRSVLVLPFVIPVVVATGLVGWLSFRSGQQAVNEIAGQLRTEIAIRVQEEVTRYLDRPHLLHQINTQVFLQGKIDLEDADALEPYFWQQSQIFKDLGTIAYANTEGEFVGANGLENYLVLSNQTTGRSLQRYAVDPNGRRGELLKERKGYDARTRSWYKTTLAVGRPTWTEIQPSAIGQRLDVSAVYPLYRPDPDLPNSATQRTFLGVLLCDLPLSGISNFLQRLKIGKTGQAFILEPSGLLVSTSTKEIPFIPGLNGQEPQRLSASNSSNPILRAALQALIQDSGNLEKIERTKQLEFFLQGDRQFLQVQRFQDGRGIDWLILVTVPESDFMQQITVNIRRTVLLCIATLIISIILGILVTYWIVRPILRVTNASEAMANGDLNQHVCAKGILELEKLAHAFNRMVEQLKETFAALEQAYHNLQNREEELAAAKEQLEAVLNAVPGSIAWMSNQGIYLGVNRYLAQTFNLLPEEIIGKELSFFQNSPDYVEFMQNFLASSERSAFQEILFFLDSQEHYFLIAVKKYQQGTVAVSVGIDITEGRRAQKEREKLKAENLRMSAELNVARQIQTMILPREEELKQISNLDISGFMEPADEVGGDYYDVLNHNGTLKIGIGDVNGHGLESGVLMLMTQTAVRTLQEAGETDPVKFLDILNRTLYKNIERMNSDKSLTLALLEYERGQLKISGQHEQVLIVRSSGEVESINTVDLGFPIGLDSHIADFIAQEQVELHLGDVVVLYTDGITEAKNIKKEQYGLERLCQVLQDHRYCNASEIKDAVIQKLREYIGEQKVFDDFTLLVLKQK